METQALSLAPRWVLETRAPWPQSRRTGPHAAGALTWVGFVRLCGSALISGHRGGRGEGHQDPALGLRLCPGLHDSQHLGLGT